MGGRAGIVVAGLAVSAVVGCRSTVDSLGYDDPPGLALRHLSGPASYPNAFRDVLEKSDAEIDAKIGAAFNQLFHGDPATQAIYFPVAGQPQAYVKDILHGDIRTDGIGIGMLVAVQLNKQDEFDRLWTYAQANMQVSSGANQGYFLSSCGTTMANPNVPCYDPYGQQQMLMALLLAYDRWDKPPAGPDAGVDAGATVAIDYAAGARQLLTVMRHKVDQNGGVVAGVTDVFDPVTGLVFEEPDVGSANITRAASELPGFYALWEQATGDPFWGRAADAARAFWAKTANAKTGLVPTRSHFDGTPVAGSEAFSAESYRSLVNFVVDQVWAPSGSPGARSWDVLEADTLLGFFISAGINQYGREFTLQGSTLDPARDFSLVAANGTLGLISTAARRSDFVQAVWDMDVAAGNSRFFTGTMQLMALLLLGGRFQVY
jgi:oligosaccharide reducing-end xylanase